MTPKETRFVKALVEGGLISIGEAAELEDAQEKHKADTGQYRAAWDLAVERGAVTVAQAERAQARAAESGAGVPAATSATSATIIDGSTQNLAPHATAIARAIAAAEGESPAKARGGGKMLGGYRLVSKLGQGGMGAVYKAVQETMDRTVAIKVLPRNLAQNQDFIGRFLREARAAGKLGHPNIVAGIDAGFADGYYYFAMEYVEGKSLGDRLESGGVLGEDEAVNAGFQIAEALEHAHEEGIIHRDVKPENILVDETGQAKLCDLGLARSTGEDMRLTQAGMAVGTAYYMSPEQAKGREPELATDIYSLGATLYHLVTGQPLFDGENSMQVMQKHINEEPQRPGEICPGGISTALEAVIMKMVAKDPEDRYESMTEVAAELEKVRSGGIPATLTASIAARRRSAGGRGSTRVRGTRSTAAVRAVGSRVGSAASDGGTERTAPLRAARRRSENKLLPVIGAVGILLVIAAALFFFMSGDPFEEKKPSLPVTPVTPSVPSGRVTPAPVTPTGPSTPVVPTGPSAFTASWRQLSIAGGPKARLVSYNGMTYDSRRRRCVLWGGSWPHQNDLWVLDLGTSKWTCLQATDLEAAGAGTERPKRIAHPDSIWMVYDDRNDLYWINALWSYDPNAGTWKKYSNKFAGFSDYGWWVRPGWAYVPGTGKAMLARRVPGLFDLKSRTAEMFARGPGERYVDGGLVYDRASKVFVLFGGASTRKGPLNDTWLFNPGTKAWTELKLETSPRLRYRHKLIWHGGINAVVMAGGEADKKRFNDLWVFETARRKWTAVKPDRHPTASWTAPAYAAARNVIAAFNQKGETWTLRISRKRAIK